MDEIVAYPRPTEKLLKAMEVAEILNVSRAFAYRLMQNGKIRTVAIEGVRRVRQEDLAVYIESRLSPPIDDMVTER
jgi:excisionase family DNA binding protein